MAVLIEEKEGREAEDWPRKWVDMIASRRRYKTGGRKGVVEVCCGVLRIVGRHEGKKWHAGDCACMRHVVVCRAVGILYIKHMCLLVFGDFGVGNLQVLC